MAAIIREAIDSALRAIQTRLIEIGQQIETLSDERETLERAEHSLLAVHGEVPRLAESPQSTPSDIGGEPAPRQGSLRARLQAVLKEAGPGGQTIQQLRTRFTDAKAPTLAATLSNLKRAGLVDSKNGCWMVHEAPQPNHFGGGEDIKDIGDPPGHWHNVSERNYEVVTHPRTGVSLARRA